MGTRAHGDKRPTVGGGGRFYCVREGEVGVVKVRVGTLGELRHSFGKASVTVLRAPFCGAVEECKQGIRQRLVRGRGGVQLRFVEGRWRRTLGKCCGDEGGDVAALQERARRQVAGGAGKQHVERDHVDSEAWAAGGERGDDIVEGGRGAQHGHRGERVIGLGGIDGVEQCGGVRGWSHAHYSICPGEQRQEVGRMCVRKGAG